MDLKSAAARSRPWAGTHGTLRPVTTSQVDQAVLLLRESAGRPAVELMTSLLRVLDLAVVPDAVIPRPRR